MNFRLILKVILFLTIYSCGNKKEIQKIQNKISELEKIKSAMNISINIRPSNTKTDSLIHITSFKKPMLLRDSITTRRNVNKYMDSIFFTQDDGIIKLWNNSVLFNYIIGVEIYFDNKINFSDFVAKKIIFSDKTTQTIFDTIQNYRLQDKFLKEIEKIEIDALIRYPNVKHYTFNRLKTKTLIEGEQVLLTKMNDKEVSFFLPSSLEKRIVGIYSYYKNGKALLSKSSYGNSSYPKEQANHIEDLIKFYAKVIIKIENNELVSSDMIENYIEKNTPILTKKTTQMYSMTYEYEANVDSVRLFVQNKKDISYIRKIIITK